MTVTMTMKMTTHHEDHHCDHNNSTVYSGGSHHEHVRIGVSEGAEVGHSVLNQCSKDKAEADSQVDINGLNEAVGIGQRSPGSHHQSGHGQYCGHSWK